MMQFRLNHFRPACEESRGIFEFLAGILFISLILMACGSEPDNDRKPHKTTPKLDSIQLFRQTMEAEIPVSGTLRAWKQVDVSLPFKAHLISKLVERNMEVKKGDFLASVWNLERRKDFTPIDLRAPFSGIVTNVYYAIDADIPAEQIILTLKNFDNFTMSLTLPYYSIGLVKVDQTFYFEVDSVIYYGHVAQVEEKSGALTLFVQNLNNRLTESMYITGAINVGEITGDYISGRYFGRKDSLAVIVDDAVTLYLKKVAIADSLILIYPPLPGIERLRVMQKNVDLMP